MSTRIRGDLLDLAAIADADLAGHPNAARLVAGLILEQLPRDPTSVVLGRRRALLAEVDAHRTGHPRRATEPAR